MAAWAEDFMVVALCEEHRLRRDRHVPKAATGIAFANGIVTHARAPTVAEKSVIMGADGKLATAEKRITASPMPTPSVLQEYYSKRVPEWLLYARQGQGAFGPNGADGNTLVFHIQKVTCIVVTYTSLHHIMHCLLHEYQLSWEGCFTFMLQWYNKVIADSSLNSSRDVLSRFLSVLNPSDIRTYDYKLEGAVDEQVSLRRAAATEVELMCRHLNIYPTSSPLYAGNLPIAGFLTTPSVPQFGPGISGSPSPGPATLTKAARAAALGAPRKPPAIPLPATCSLCGQPGHSYKGHAYDCNQTITRACNFRNGGCGFLHAKFGPRATPCGADAPRYIPGAVPAPRAPVA